MAFLDFAALKQSLPIEEAVPLLGLAMKQTGQQLRGPCPVCQSGGPRSLVITPAKQAFYCFGERIGGDVIALAAHVRQSDMKQAAQFLAGEDEQSSQRGSTNNSATVPRERSKEAVRSLQPLSYLESDHPKVKALGLNPETCNAFGAGYAPKGIMRGRLAFPIHNGEATLVAYGGIALDGEDTAILFPKDFDPEPYVFNGHGIGEGSVILCRSPLEVLLASQNGIDNTVSFLTDRISATQLRLLAYLIADVDNAFVELP